MAQRPADNELMGLYVWKKGTNGSAANRDSKTAVDIIAVQGLGANPFYTWVRTLPKDGSSDHGKQVMWLRDLLPQYVEDAQISTFSYWSDWYTHGKGIKTSIRQIGEQLAEAIRLDRSNREVQKRPIIFIGHSMGGLVIEQALVIAKLRPDCSDIVSSTAGVVFLGTPHHGSELAKYASFIAKVKQNDPSLLDFLRPTAPELFNLGRDFNRSYSTLKTMHFYEQAETNYIQRYLGPAANWLGTMAVTQHSAVSDTAAMLYLTTDHSGLNKFASEEDSNFHLVRNVIVEMSRDAHNIVASRMAPASSQAPQTFYMVHRHRVENFVGREEELQQISRHFAETPTGRPRIIILCALGGQGKSQIALEYCRQARSRYRGMFWINASSEALVLQSYRHFLTKIEGPCPSSAHSSQQDATASEEAVEKFRRILQEMDKAWLLVFDNYDNPMAFPAQRLRSLIPDNTGDVVITSRFRDLFRLGRVLHIKPLHVDSAIELLLSSFEPSDILERHRDVAATIIDRLGGLALAIDQASAYIRHRMISLDKLADFLAIYDEKRQLILEHTPAIEESWEYTSVQSDDENDRSRAISAFTTWEISFSYLQTSCPSIKDALAHFLSLSAFLAAIEVEEFLFEWFNESLKDNNGTSWLRLFTEITGVLNRDNHSESDMEEHIQGTTPSTGWNHDLFWNWLIHLHKFSLVEDVLAAEGHVGARFKLHPLIRDWLQIRQKAKGECGRKMYVRETALMLQNCVRRCAEDNVAPEQQKRLVKHVDACLDHDQRFCGSANIFHSEDRSYTFLACFAHFYYSQRLYQQSAHMFQALVESREQRLGIAHPLTLASMDLLATLLGRLDRFREAQEIRRKTLAIREVILGKKHSATLRNNFSLADLLTCQHKYEEAGSRYLQGLALCGTVPSKELSTTLTGLNGLAILLENQGKYKQAEEIHRQVLTWCKKTLGEEHIETLTSMSKLGLNLAHQRQYEEAERIQRWVSIRNEIVLGDENPSTLAFTEDLASVLESRGKDEEAEKLYRRVLAARTATLGEDNLETLSTTGKLAMVLISQGKYEEAEKILHQSLSLNTPLTSGGYSTTLGITTVLTVGLVRQGKFGEAERILREQTALCERALGKEYLSMFGWWTYMARLLMEMGRLEEAEQLITPVVKQMTSVLGYTHRPTIESVALLSDILRLQDREEEAIRLLSEEIHIRNQILGHGHPATQRLVDALTEWDEPSSP